MNKYDAHGVIVFAFSFRCNFILSNQGYKSKKIKCNNII